MLRHLWMLIVIRHPTENRIFTTAIVYRVILRRFQVAVGIVVLYWRILCTHKSLKDTINAPTIGAIVRRFQRWSSSSCAFCTGSSRKQDDAFAKEAPQLRLCLQGFSHCWRLFFELRDFLWCHVPYTTTIQRAVPA